MSQQDIRLIAYPFTIRPRGEIIALRRWEGVNSALALNLLRSGRLEWPIRMSIRLIEGTRLLLKDGTEIKPGNISPASTWIYLPPSMEFRIEDEEKLTLVEGQFFLEEPGPVPE